MTAAVPAIAGVVDRIQRIEQRFRTSQAQAPTVVDAGAPFDPFGEAYQRALDTRPVAATASSALSPGATARFIEGRPALAMPMTGASHGHGGIAVPPELAPYGNGQIPADALRPISQADHHRLWAPAAEAWDDLVGAAAQAGFDLRITDSYRSYEHQVDLAHRKGLYRNGGLAAVPGTSNHGWGLAVDADVRDPALLEWLRQNGPAFGWVEPVPREPWHWEFRPTA